MPRQRIIIVGGVAAGPAAGAEAARTDPEAEVVLFEQGRDISYGACEMPWLLDGTVPTPDTLVVNTPAGLESSRGVSVRTLTRVERIVPGRGRVLAKDLVTGEVTEERFDKLVLATGARVSWPAVEGLEGEGVRPFRTLDDAAHVQSLAAAGATRWVIIGGGFIGLEVGERLAGAGHRVTILAPGGPLSGRVDGRILSAVSHAMEQTGVTVRAERAVRVRRGVPGAPIAVGTDAGEFIGCEGVVVATGIIPDTTLGGAAGIRIGRHGGYVVDAGMRTSATSVWACGDCVETLDLVTGRSRHVPLSPVAYRTGHVAGANAARRGRQAPRRFSGTVGAFGLRIGGLEVGFAGLTLDTARQEGFDAVAAEITAGSRAHHMEGRMPLDVRLVAERGSGRLLGVQVAGTEGAALRVNAVVPLLRAGAGVDDLHDTDLVYSPPLAPSIDPLIRAAQAVRRALDT